MIKKITKEQFREAFSPTIEGKNITEPKMQLLPGDKCLINGNIYSIKVEIYEDLVILEKISAN